MVQAEFVNKLIIIFRITCIGQFRPITSDFFVACKIVIRNKSPPATVEFSKI